MISKHKILEAYENGSLLYDDNVADFSEKEDLERAIKWLNQSICFDVGDIREYQQCGSGQVAEYIPFDSCFFEGAWPYINGRTKLKIAALMVNDAIKNRMGCLVFYRIPIEGKWVLADVSIVNKDKKAYESSLPKERTFNSYSIIMSILGYIKLMECVNVRKKLNHPPQKLQNKRVKRNKKPLFSYYTLEVKIPNFRNKFEPLFGRHESPRRHLRRGHVREFRPAHFTFVRPCVVGRKKTGIINKDYRISRTEV